VTGVQTCALPILAYICNKKNIHYTYSGTGCIFKFDETHPFGKEENGFDEESLPNFFGSSYSIVKGFTDRLMHLNKNILNLRIRMPITGNKNPRNFITKIVNYEKVCSVPNSMTVLPELLNYVLDMMHNKITGTINLTNPGLISHNEILQMYKEIVDPTFTWKNFSQEEQRKILAADRSNNYLDTTKLETLYPQVENISGLTENNSVGFFYPHTQTIYEPFLETTYNDYINDDRNNFINGSTNNLYLYLYEDGTPINLDTNPTVDILDINGDPVDGFTGLTSCLVTEGVYKVTINNLSSESVPCLYYDLWKNLIINGSSIDDVENDFAVQPKSNKYKIGTTTENPKIYGFNFDGIKQSEKVLNTDIRKINVNIKEAYSNVAAFLI
jgi:3,5-epimerase/4-reductase